MADRLRRLEPFYGQAEQMYWVHANKGEDPTDPWRSTDYPFPGLAMRVRRRGSPRAPNSKACTRFPRRKP